MRVEIDARKRPHPPPSPPPLTVAVNSSGDDVALCVASLEGDCDADGVPGLDGDGVDAGEGEPVCVAAPDLDSEADCVPDTDAAAEELWVVLDVGAPVTVPEVLQEGVAAGDEVLEALADGIAAAEGVPDAVCVALLLDNVGLCVAVGVCDVSCYCVRLALCISDAVPEDVGDAEGLGEGV